MCVITEEYHIVTSSYAKVLDDELSVPEGAVVQVLDRNTSGWWLVKYVLFLFL